MTALLDMTPSEAVANGAQLLDEKLPGWWREITLDQLKLADCRNCVCGQLAATAAVRMAIVGVPAAFFFTNYEKTLHVLNLVWLYSIHDGWGHDYDYGFNLKPHELFMDIMTYDEYLAETKFWWAMLDAEWRKVIEARLQVDALPNPVVEPEKEEALACATT